MLIFGRSNSERGMLLCSNSDSNFLNTSLIFREGLDKMNPKVSLSLNGTLTLCLITLSLATVPKVELVSSIVNPIVLSYLTVA